MVEKKSLDLLTKTQLEKGNTDYYSIVRMHKEQIASADLAELERQKKERAIKYQNSPFYKLLFGGNSKKK